MARRSINPGRRAKPPASGNLPAGGKRILAATYESAKARQLEQGWSETSAKRAASAQAWCAVKRHYYKRGSKWVKRKESLGPHEQPPGCTPIATKRRRRNPTSNASKQQAVEAMRIYLGSVDFASVRDQQRFYSKVTTKVRALATSSRLDEADVWQQVEAEARRRGIVRPSPGRHMNPTTITPAERDVLERLIEKARQTGDDWGTIDSVGEYLDDPEDDRSPVRYLGAVYDSVMWHYGHVGDDSDPGMDKASAKRAQKQIAHAIGELEGLRAGGAGYRQSLAAINRDRARRGERPLDPQASGWTADDVLIEARRLKSNPRDYDDPDDDDNDDDERRDPTDLELHYAERSDNPSRHYKLTSRAAGEQIPGNPYMGDAVELAQKRKYEEERTRWERGGRRGPPPAPPRSRQRNPRVASLSRRITGV